MTYWLVLATGLFAGVLMGVFLMALLFMARTEPQCECQYERVA